MSARYQPAVAYQRLVDAGGRSCPACYRLLMPTAGGTVPPHKRGRRRCPGTGEPALGGVT